MEIELDRAVGLLDHLGRVAWRDGEEITITKGGKPYLKLMAHPDGEPIAKVEGTRGIGRLDRIRADIQTNGHSNIWMAPDFDDDTDIIEAFEGKYSNDEHLFEGYLIRPDSNEETSGDD